MEHVLDNPIFNALSTGNKRYSIGEGAALYFQQDVAPFAGLKTNSAEDFEALDALLPGESTFVIFSPVPVNVPARFNVTRQFSMYQMVFEDDHGNDMQEIIADLDDSNVEQMLSLTKLTNPGPFLQRTIELSNYTGILNGTDLVAMAGHRMQPLPYVEISAVCTHPDHTGKGYAAMLLKEQIKRIKAAGKIPFLHVLQSNKGAVSVYERIGFKTRTEMLGYVCQKITKAG